MSEYRRKIYDGVMRLPHELVHQFGREVTILSDYKSAVLFNPAANRALVAKSLEFLAESIWDELMRERRKAKKGGT